MEKLTKKIFKKWLPMMLSAAMVINFIPGNLPAKAIVENAVTITVTDEDKNPIENAEVTFTIYSETDGTTSEEKTVITDVDGQVEVMPSSDYIENEFTLETIKVKAASYPEKTFENIAIEAQDFDYTISLTKNTISDITVNPYSGTYDTIAHPAFAFDQAYYDEYTIKYVDSEGVDQVISSDSDIPTVTNAGEYTYTLKFEKDEFYTFENEYTATVTPAQYEGKFEFNYNGEQVVYIQNIPADGLDFGIAEANEIEGTIEYSILDNDQDPNQEPSCSIGEDGIVQIADLGIYTIKAELKGNYTTSITYKLTVISDEKTQVITLNELIKGKLEIVDVFNDIVYIADDKIENKDIISGYTIKRKFNNDKGDITLEISVGEKKYSIGEFTDKTGIKFSKDNYFVSVADDNKFFEFLDEYDGNVTITLTFNKAAYGNRTKYPAAQASYNLTFKYDDSTDLSYVVDRKEGETTTSNPLPNENGWYDSNLIVKGPTVLDKDNVEQVLKVSLTANGNYTDEVTITEDTEYVFIKTLSGTKVRVKVTQKIDTTSPEISIEKYQEASLTEVEPSIRYYTDSAFVTFRITEEQFNEVIVSVTKDGVVINNYEDYTVIEEKDEDENIIAYLLTVNLSGDGVYSIAVNHKDLAGNTLENAVQTSTLVLDTVAPTVDVKYNEKDFYTNWNQYYFNENVETVTISVTDKNFDKDDKEAFMELISIKDINGKPLLTDENSKTYYTVSDWTVNGDVYTKTISFIGDGNYTFNLECKDKLGHTSKYQSEEDMVYTIDKEIPTDLSISYEDPTWLDNLLNKITFGFWKNDVTVTLSATDLIAGVESFSYRYVNAEGVSSVNKGSEYITVDSNNIVYDENDASNASLTFKINAQFNGLVDFKVVDKAGNETTLNDEHRVVVDNIAPNAKVEFNKPVNTDGNISYYDGNINTTITINEANFFAGDVVVSVTKDGQDYPVTPKWTDNSVDVHVGTFTLTQDGDYVITVSYTDKSKNEMKTYTSNQLTIDTNITEPVITVNGQESNGVAFKEEVNPLVVFDDKNFADYEVTLTRTNYGNKNVNVTNLFVNGMASGKTGGTVTFKEIEKKPENDGIYTLTARMTDKSGHTSYKTVTFTVNRFGSVYEYNDYLVSLIENGGAFVQDVNGDLVITEYNATKLVGGSLVIEITRDGKPISNPVYTVNPEINTSVKPGNSGWYQYQYTISKDNFKADGVYKISISSKDAVGNTPEINTFKDKNILFRVDTAIPEITSIVNLEKDIINANEVEVKYNVFDSIGLKSIKILVNGEVVSTITDFSADLNEYNGTFTLTESNSAQHVQIVVEDLAGNIVDTDAETFTCEYVFNKDVTVSTNLFVRFYANKPLFFGSLVGLAAAAYGIFVIIGKRKKEEDKETEIK